MQEQQGDRATTVVPATMQAITQEIYGDRRVLRLRELAVPRPPQGGVLIAVRAAGLDRGVVHAMTGLPYLGRIAFGLRRPRNPVPGMDVAGVVVAVGPDAMRFRVGDEVLGCGRGTFAEFATAAERSLVLKPPGLTFTQAAALPVSAVTAFTALHDVGQVAPGQHVAILGASGGVGSYAVQFATAAGARVTAVCSAAKVDFVSALGADSVLDRATEDFSVGHGPFDLIVDIAGTPSVSRLRRALTPRGTAVIVGGEGGGRLSGGLQRPLGALALSPVVGQKLAMLFAVVRAEGLERILPLVATGAVRPAVDRTFPLARAVEALDHLESGFVRGKLVLTV